MFISNEQLDNGITWWERHVHSPKNTKAAVLQEKLLEFRVSITTLQLQTECKHS